MPQRFASSKLAPYRLYSHAQIPLQEDAAEKAHKLICAPQLKIMADLCTVTFPPTDKDCSQPLRYHFAGACCVVSDLGEYKCRSNAFAQHAAPDPRWESIEILSQRPGSWAIVCFVLDAS
jgi:hypothetical protein